MVLAAILIELLQLHLSSRTPPVEMARQGATALQMTVTFLLFIALTVGIYVFRWIKKYQHTPHSDIIDR